MVPEFTGAVSQTRCFPNPYAFGIGVLVEFGVQLMEGKEATWRLRMYLWHSTQLNVTFV